MRVSLLPATGQFSIDFVHFSSQRFCQHVRTLQFRIHLEDSDVQGFQMRSEPVVFDSIMFRMRSHSTGFHSREPEGSIVIFVNHGFEKFRVGRIHHLDSVANLLGARRSKGMTSCIAIDKALYSLTIVLVAISDWSLLDQQTGQSFMKITYPVRLLTHYGSCLSSTPQSDAKSAST